MHIILLILKIAGIIVAVLFGLLFVMLMLLLFVPLRYRFSGSGSAARREVSVRGKVSWLLSAVSVTFGYEKDFFVTVRLLGIPLRRKKAAVKETKEAVKETLEEITQEIPDEPLNTGGALPSAISGDDREEPPPDTQDTVRPRNKHRILREKWKRILSVPGRIRKKCAALTGQIRQMKHRAAVWLEFLKSEEVKQTFSLLKKQMKRLFRHILPGTVRVHGRFGFDDPSLTGKATGFISMMPLFYRKNISVVPVFTGFCLEGDFYLKGRIRAVSLLILGGRILLDSRFRRTLRHFRRMSS